MSRALIIVRTEEDRAKAAVWARKAPSGCRILFQETKRTLPQNDRMWAMLTEIAAQKEHCGQKYTPDQWKALFMHACGQEMEFVRTLDGQTWMPLGYRSSDLEVEEMSALIEFILAWGTENGVRFSDAGEVAA